MIDEFYYFVILSTKLKRRRSMTISEDKIYWRILERYLRLHSDLNVQIFGKNQKIIVTFYEKNNEKEIIAYGEAEQLGKAINLASKSYPLHQTLDANLYQAETPKDDKLEINSYDSLERAILNENCVISILNEMHGLNDKLIELSLGEKTQGIKFSQNESELLTLIIQATHFYQSAH